MCACRAPSREGGAKPGGSETREAVAVRAPVSAGSARFVARADGSVVFHGMCDASGAVRLAGSRVVVANDDDNALRVYDAEKGGEPLSSTDLSAFVAGDQKNREAHAASEESDIEAGTLAFGKAFWITSHGRGDKGKKDDSLSRLFATVLAESGQIAPADRSYAELRRDLADSPALASYRLKKASKRDPEDQGGLNIEGLALGPNGSLLVGFRNPLSAGRALVVPLTNAAAVVGGGARAQFETPWELDLGGRGVRDLTTWKGQVLVAAGPPEKAGDFQLYVWDVAGKTVAPVETSALEGSSPEALVAFEDQDRVLVLSDDGDRLQDGIRCGKAKPDTVRRFRGTWLRIARE